MFHHSSKTAGIKVLTPHVSNHGKLLVYFSTKRENVLVYLSNAVEKYCRENHFPHEGMYQKWGSYGFTKEGILRLEEYYPNAIIDTYQGESGYIYSVEHIENYCKQADVPYGIITKYEVPVTECEYVSDAYEAIMASVQKSEILLQRYDEITQTKLSWIDKTIKAEYQKAENYPEYRAFLKAKFQFLSE